MRDACGEVAKQEDAEGPKGMAEGGTPGTGSPASGHTHASCQTADASFLSAVVPALILASANAYNLWTEHWEHWSHMPPLEERVEYPYQNIRTRNYQWGDGDKVCSYPQLLLALC
jgi:hypothetical protein